MKTVSPTGLPDLLRTQGTLITGILVIAVLYFARDVFIPLALAGLLAFLLAPAATRLERWRVRKTLAAILVILLSLAGTIALAWVVLGQIYSLAIDLPQYQQNVTEKLDSLHLNSAGKLGNTVAMLASLGKQIKNGGAAISPIPRVVPRQRLPSRIGTMSASTANNTTQPVAVQIEQPEESMLAVAERTAIPLLHPLTTAFIIVIFLVFMLLGREDLLGRGLRLAGSERIYATTTAIEDASARVSRYLQMQLMVNLCYGTVSGLLLWRIGVPHPLLWAVLTCLLRFVPYIGILMAAIGPLVLSFAVSPHWGMLVWTVMMYVILEIATANFVEPMLYGASTGMSAIAILTAAIFWTLVWGFPGLLLSTPLTVCLLVMGRHVPHLHFLEVLFGEETVLPSSDRFYQRMLASDIPAARSLLEQLMKTTSRDEVYDTVLVPALSQIEEARHSEQMTGTRAEEVLQGVEELAEDVAGKAEIVAEPESGSMKRVACVPARDFADEIACQLAIQVLFDTASVQVMSADLSTSDLLESLESLAPDVICVIGIPPHAMRHLRMRCHQIRTRVPNAVVIACVLSKESDLSNVRSRIKSDDAQHVVCSMQLLKEYLTSLLHSQAPQPERGPETEEEIKATTDLVETVHEMQNVDVFDESDESIFSQLVTNLARTFEAPIALFAVADGQRRFWEAQCGLGEDMLSTTGSEWDLSMCSKVVFSDSTLILTDTAEDKCFANDPFLKDKGIRFYAGAPLKAHDGEVMGSLCVLDTRPRQITEEQKETLTSVANAVMTAIELHRTAKTDEQTVSHQS